MGLYEILKTQDNSVVGKQGSIFIAPDAGTKASKAIGYDSFSVFRKNEDVINGEPIDMGSIVIGLGNSGSIYIEKNESYSIPPPPEELDAYSYIREFINLLAVRPAGSPTEQNVLEAVAPYLSTALSFEYAEAVYITPTKYVNIIGVEIEGKGFLPVRHQVNYYRLQTEKGQWEDSAIMNMLRKDSEENDPLAPLYKDENEKAEAIFEFVTNKVSSPEKAKEVQYEIASLFAKYSGEGKSPIPAIILSIVEFLKKAHMTNVARSYQMQIFEALL